MCDQSRDRYKLPRRILMIRQAQQILQRLDEIVLRPNPLSEVEYIDLLIHAEEMDGEPGTAQRI